MQRPGIVKYVEVKENSEENKNNIIEELEIWVNENHIYKQKLFESMPDNYVMIFIDYLIVSNDINVATHILKKRAYELLMIPYNTLRNYTTQEMIKICKLIRLMNIEPKDMIKILSKCELSKLTKHNINDVLKYVKNYDDMINGKLKIHWGPGNHNNIENNIYMHYIKHVVSDENEGRMIKNIMGICDNMNENEVYELYKNYPLNNFRKMEKITIHTDGRHTYLSGIYQNMFIVGRYSDDVFGISSCYYLFEGEKSKRYTTKCMNV